MVPLKKNWSCFLKICLKYESIFYKLIDQSQGYKDVLRMCKIINVELRSEESNFTDAVRGIAEYIPKLITHVGNDVAKHLTKPYSYSNNHSHGEKQNTQTAPSPFSFTQ